MEALGTVSDGTQLHLRNDGHVYAPGTGGWRTRRTKWTGCSRWKDREGAGGTERKTDEEKHSKRHFRAGWQGRMMIPAGAIQPVFYCPGFLSMVFYVKKETAPRVFWVVNWRAFYYFSTTFDGRDKSRFATKSEAWFWAAEKMTRFDMPQEWPKRCFSWPEEALLTNDEDFVYLPRQHFLSIGFYATGGALIAANRAGSFLFYYQFTTFRER